MRKFLAATFAALCLTGCATVDPNLIVLTLQSEPAGAMIYENGKAHGMAPVVGNYRPSTQQRAAGQMNTRSFTAVWPSGAQTATSLVLHLSKGNRPFYVFRRPASAPNLDKDLAHAAQVQRNAILVQEAKRQEDRENSRALAEVLSTFNTTRSRQSISCTSMNMGGGLVHTDCD